MPTTRVRICGCSHEEGRHEIVDGRHLGPCTHGCGCPGFHSRRHGRSVGVLPASLALAATTEDVRSAIEQAFHAIGVAKAALDEAESALRWAVKLAKGSTYGKSPNKTPSRSSNENAVPAAVQASPPQPPGPPRSASPAPAPRVLSRPRSARDGELGRGEERVLVAVAQQPNGVTREQIAVLTGYKKSTRNTYLKLLRADGLVRDDGDRVQVTQQGIERLPEGFEKLPVGEELVAYWRAELPAGELVVLDCLLTAHPARVGIEQIERSTGYTKSTRNTYLKKLRARELVERHRDGTVSISESFAASAKLGARKVG